MPAEDSGHRMNGEEYRLRWKYLREDEYVLTVKGKQEYRDRQHKVALDFLYE